MAHSTLRSASDIHRQTQVRLCGHNPAAVTTNAKPTPLLVAVLAGLVLASAIVMMLPKGAVVPTQTLDVPGVSHLSFRHQLAVAGFDQPPSGVGFRRLSWSGPLRDERDLRALVASLQVSPEALAREAHTSLVSTQNSIKAGAPVIESIAGWSNERIDVYVMRQKFLEKGEYRTYGIAHERARGATAFFFELTPDGVDVTGDSCFACHPAGPRALRPLRPDLATNSATLDAFNAHIAQNVGVHQYFPDDEPEQAHGDPLTVAACARCHGVGRMRGPLFRVNAPSVRALTWSGAMPRDQPLSDEDARQLVTWLDHEP